MERIIVTEEIFDEFERMLDEEPKDLPRLRKLFNKKSPWEETKMKEFSDMTLGEAEAALIILKNEIESREPGLTIPFEAKFETWKDGTINVQLPAIRGYDWQIVRKIGIGTYMTHAARFSDENDVKEVVEEWSAPDMRAIWDEKTDIECIQACLNTLVPGFELPSCSMKGERA